MSTMLEPSISVSSEPVNSFMPSVRARSQALTTPGTPSRSVSATARSPRFCASSTYSSGWLAPSKNEKLLFTQSGT